MNFIEGLNNELNNETQLTENGAVGFRTTGKHLLDLNFNVSSLRNKTENEIVEKFVKAFYEDKMLAMKWLFFAADIRGGMGERRLLRTCLMYLAENHSAIAEAVVELVPEYNRWDSLWCLLDTPLKAKVVNVVNKQLESDIKRMEENKSISLLAKWMPSLCASSRESKRRALLFCKELGYTDSDAGQRKYRKTMVALRKYLRIVETQMSAGKWDEIQYDQVPSRANLLYKEAFMRHDEERRKAYLASLQKGETKINAAVLFPHNIVHKYIDGDRWYRYCLKSLDTVNEELWKALPDYVQGAGNTICVADGSGSMTCSAGQNTTVTCLDVANALAIYFAERSSGQFKDKYITFSEHPQLVDFNKANTLREKIEIALRHNEVANTNIEAVFDLILKTAVNQKMTQDDMPTNILVLSDMEFDACATCSHSDSTRWGRKIPDVTLFDTIAQKYAEHGYKLPRLVFWNICSRTGTIPIKENDLGVALVSGFSPAIMRMVLSNKTDPFECLVEQLNTERYQPVEDAIRELIA